MLMRSLSYKQETKNHVRHTLIRNAVELLTINRSGACCVRRSYVRDLYEYFIQLNESHEQTEVLKIDKSYIREWERIHSNLIGNKRPDELSVCYLSGPEPENDFNEFVSLGVLPQNIWAFESERSTYLQALNSVDGSTYMQPKIIKTSIERFFENTPKKFDIVYIDACASLISDQHALRCVASVFQNHRLNSPGVLITNFAYFDDSITAEKTQYVDLLSRFNILRGDRKAALINDDGKIHFNDEHEKMYTYIENNLENAYGEFITAMICDAASITIPTIRFCNSNYLQTISTTKPTPRKAFSISEINTIKDNTLYKYLALNELLCQKSTNHSGVNRIHKLASELSGTSSGFDLLSSMQKIYDIKTNISTIQPEIKDVVAFFDKNNILYQFLDKPNSILFFDSVINQLSYPMHYACDKATRLTYIAKEKRMFADLMLFDECRYIYDWIPSIHQIPKSFSNLSWQYTFRFGLDGLIKQRINYNNEFFFQGSVISKTNPRFGAMELPNRTIIN